MASRAADQGSEIEGNGVTDTYLRDVLTLPDAVHAGDFKVELTGGFTEAATAERVREYVVTDQLRRAFREALSVVRAGLRDGNSYAAYLHGSFGSGKSHFLTVLHAVLNGSPEARAKRGLQPVIVESDEWLRGKRFLMVPYHLIGATDLDAAILGGYVAHVRRTEPDAAIPAVYRSDAMLDDARHQREFLDDDAAFARWLGADSDGPDPDDLDVIDGAPAEGWTTADLDVAFAGLPGSSARRALESALLSGPMTSYARGATGDAAAFLPLDDGLAVIAAHARSLGYDGLVLFLDELILWLQAHMSNQEFVNNQVSKLVKLIESAVAERAVPIISFISRQRDLSKLVGEDVTGADVKNLEAQVEYLAGRFDVISLEDTNLPAIVRERVLRPRPGMEQLLDQAFTSIESTKPGDRDVLLDATGATGATWDDFRRVYPLSPALLNVLVSLSGALQRERTGLKLLQEMLYRRRDDMKLGELIPLGDLWDVLADGTGEAFTDRLRREADAGHRFYARARAYLLERYGSDTSRDFVALDRFVKTLLLAALAPQLPALARLTGARIAALNLGSIRSRTVEPARMVVTRLQELQAEFGELRSEGDQDPVFTLHLNDLDVEPLLDAVGEKDSLGARRIWVKEQLWETLGIKDSGEFVSRRDFVWRGTRRTAEFVFANVRDNVEVPDLQFKPEIAPSVRFVLDYPFDVEGHSPADDALRVERLRRAGVRAATVVWLPLHLTEQRSAQLGRLLKIEYLLQRDRLEEYAADLSTDLRLRMDLGEVGDGPLHVTADWRRKIDQQAAAQGVTGDLSAEDVRGWIAELGMTGLDRPVSGLVIATYALVADRAWVHHGVVVDAPDIDRVGPGYALRAQELPSADEFAAARRRAADLFGLNVSDVLFARNVRTLAERTRGKVRELEAAVTAVWQALTRHEKDLGLTAPGPRTTLAQSAADLLARLAAARDDTTLVRALADGANPTTDPVLGTAIKQAPAVLAALDDVEWSLLESVYRWTSQEILGERAQRLLDQVAEAARDPQNERDLVPVLGRIRGEAVALAAEAARLVVVDPPPPKTPIEPPEKQVAVAPAPGLVNERRIVGAAELDAVVATLRTEFDRDPSARFELTWRRVPTTGREH